MLSTTYQRPYTVKNVPTLYIICTIYVHCTTCTGAVIVTSVMYVITLCYFEWTAKKIVVPVYETFVAKKNYPKICAM